MKVFYAKKGYNIDNLKDADIYVVILTANDWDDYGYKTSFNVFVSYDGMLLEWDRIKLLFLNQMDLTSSSSYIESLMESSEKYIDFDNLNESFISVNNFYEAYQSFLQSTEYVTEFSKKLFDLLYIEQYPNTIMNNQTYELLIQMDAFEISLLRERNIQEDRKNGYINAINPNNSSALNCKFNFIYNFNDITYNFNFDFSPSDLPYRISVLIGENGVGKTRTLETIVKKFCNNQTLANFEPYPSFIRNLIVYSYNPFESIPIKNESISFDYQYFGPRRLKYKEEKFSTEVLRFSNSEEYMKLLQYIYNNDFSPNDIDDATKILNNQFPNFAEDFITEVINKCDYFKEDYIVDYSNYNKITKNSLLKICIKDKRTNSNQSKLLNFLYTQVKELIPAFKFVGIQINDVNYSITSYIDVVDDMSNENAKFVILDNDKKEIPLSSGQNTFIQFIVNTLSMIRKKSLIIIDEPENTLHPTFEVDMMSILKKILEIYDSFAIIATHSAHVVREVSSDNVKILVRNRDTGMIDIQKPVINTFGASIGTINNYVFDDLYKEKNSINVWLTEQYGEITTYEEFEEKYIDIVSSELMQTAYLHYKNKRTQNV